MELRSHRGYETPVGSFWQSYTDYPELYDRFALSTVQAAKRVHEMIDFRDARVLDVASGTGRNAIEHARIARSVIGIEPFTTMRNFAIARARAAGIKNVEFRRGVAEDLSMFADDSFDIAVTVPPDWRPAFAQSPAVPFGNPLQRELDRRLQELGFSVHDSVADLDYGTQQEALETFGFIYGPAAIDHILDNQTSHQEWADRAYIKQV